MIVFLVGQMRSSPAEGVRRAASGHAVACLPVALGLRRSRKNRLRREFAERVGRDSGASIVVEAARGASVPLVRNACAAERKCG
tara:strand:- start:697 stop:948 length:252 start_codon:yes stop_codon:yes gene_type:complete